MNMPLLIFVNKGIEISTHSLTLEIIADTCGSEVAKAATFLSGPSFAKESEEGAYSDDLSINLFITISHQLSGVNRPRFQLRRCPNHMPNKPLEFSINHGSDGSLNYYGLRFLVKVADMVRFFTVIWAMTQSV